MSFRSKIDATSIQISSIDPKIYWADGDSKEALEKAYVASQQGDEKVFICQVLLGDEILPGQTRPGGCAVSHDNKAVLQKAYKVLLVQQDVDWVSPRAYRYQNKSYDGVLPKNAYRLPSISLSAQKKPIIGGFYRRYANASPKPLYICRAMHGTTIHIGKAINRRCIIVANGASVSIPTYQILITQRPL